MITEELIFKSLGRERVEYNNVKEYVIVQFAAV